MDCTQIEHMGEASARTAYLQAFLQRPMLNCFCFHGEECIEF